MLNIALLKHWQNWLLVGFVALLVVVSMRSTMKLGNKETK